MPRLRLAPSRALARPRVAVAELLVVRRLLAAPMNETVETHPLGFSVFTLAAGGIAFAVLLLIEYSRAAEPHYWAEFYSWGYLSWFAAASLAYFSGVTFLAFTVHVFTARRLFWYHRLLLIPAIGLIALGGCYAYTILRSFARDQPWLHRTAAVETAGHTVAALY